MFTDIVSFIVFFIIKYGKNPNFEFRKKKKKKKIDFVILRLSESNFSSSYIRGKYLQILKMP